MLWLNYIVLGAKGFSESKKALKLIKDSNEFAGIEMSNTDSQIDSVLESGLKVSIHNPARMYNISIESPNFIEVITSYPEIISSCKKSSLPFISFHLGRSCFYFKPQSKEILLSNIKKNLNYLNSLVDKKIILEEMGFYPKMIYPIKDKSAKLFMTSIKLQKKVSESTNAGILVDISHTLMTAHSRIGLGLYKGTEENYFSDVLKNIGENIFELHLNSPLMTNEGLVDKHFVLNPLKKESKIVLNCAKEATIVCPNLKIITLEMEPLVEPIKHAKILINQAKILRKKIGV